MAISDLRHFGYAEAEILNHTTDWLNYTILFEREQQMQQIRLHERLAIDRAVLTGIMFHQPEKGIDIKEQMLATLGVTTDDDDDDLDYISTPQDGPVDLHRIRKWNERRSDERRRNAETATSTETETGSGDGGTDDAGGTTSDTGTDDAGGERPAPRVRVIGLADLLG